MNQQLTLNVKKISSTGEAQVSFPKPCLDVTQQTTVTGMEAAYATTQAVSSRPKLPCMTATYTRMQTEIMAMGPMIMETISNILERSRTGTSHWVFKDLMATALGSGIVCDKAKWGGTHVNFLWPYKCS